MATSGIVVEGLMAGITNAGTHRKPLRDCETCDSKGHMEGIISGRVTEGNRSLKSECRVLGSYVIKFDHCRFY